MVVGFNNIVWTGFIIPATPMLPDRKLQLHPFGIADS
jgi:hypothetical protein